MQEQDVYTLAYQNVVVMRERIIELWARDFIQGVMDDVFGPGVIKRAATEGGSGRYSDANGYDNGGGSDAGSDSGGAGAGGGGDGSGGSDAGAGDGGGAGGGGGAYDPDDPLLQAD